MTFGGSLGISEPPQTTWPLIVPYWPSAVDWVARAKQRPRAERRIIDAVEIRMGFGPRGNRIGWGDLAGAIDLDPIRIEWPAQPPAGSGSWLLGRVARAIDKASGVGPLAPILPERP